MMPYPITRNDKGQYCVNGKCYEKESDAIAYQSALYANAPEAKAYDCPVKVIKQANGLYRWYGASSVNALDRDEEIVSETAMHMDVYRTRTYGDDSSLNVFHIYDDSSIQKTRIGGPPDYRAIVDGHLIETGEFDDTVLGRGFAKFMQEYPESTDGKGWGMSIGFFGVPDHDKVYRLMQIKERSVLPLSEAANPFTSFGVKEISKMAFNERQLAFLDQVKEMASDAETREAVKMIVAATDQSKALDAAGVQRKAAVITAPPPLSADKPNVANQLGFVQKQGPEEDAALAAASANLEVAATAVSQAQDAVTAVTTAEPAEDATVQPETTLAVEGKPEEDPKDPASEPAEATPSDEMLKQIAKYVDDRIASAMEEMKAMVAGSAKSIATDIAKNIQGSVKELEKTALIKAYNEEPAPSILERLQAFSAAKSKTNIPTEDNPLAKEKGTYLPTDDQYVSNLQAKLGFAQPQE